MALPSSFVPDDGEAPSSFVPDEAEGGPSELESGARGVAQGASLGFADELTGGAEALLDKLKGSNTPFAEAYRKHRDESRTAYDEAAKANPASFTAGKIGGGLATGLATAPLTGGASLAGAIASGAGMGAANALGDAKELDEGSAKDALEQGAVGALTGGVGHGLGSLLSKGAGKAALAVAPKLEDVAVSQGRRAIGGGINSLSTDAALSKDAVLRALEEGHVGVGDTVGDIAKKLGDARVQSGKQVEDIGDALTSLGAKNNVESTAQKWLDEAKKIEENTLDSPVPALLRKHAEALLNKSDAVEHTLPLNQGLNIKRGLQSNANYGKLEADALNGARKDMAFDMRQGTEDAIKGLLDAHPGDEGVSTLASNFGDANKRAGDLIAASNVANKGASQAAKRNKFGLRDIAAGGAMLAHGNIPGAAVALGASHLATTRGAATAASLAFNASKSLGKVGKLAISNPAKLGQFGSVLSSAAARGSDALNAAHFVLGNSQPEYQKMVSKLDDEGDQ